MPSQLSVTTPKAHLKAPTHSSQTFPSTYAKEKGYLQSAIEYSPSHDDAAVQLLNDLGQELPEHLLDDGVLLVIRRCMMLSAMMRMGWLAVVLTVMGHVSLTTSQVDIDAACILLAAVLQA